MEAVTEEPEACTAAAWSQLLIKTGQVDGVTFHFNWIFQEHCEQIGEKQVKVNNNVMVNCFIFFCFYFYYIIFIINFNISLRSEMILNMFQHFPGDSIVSVTGSKLQIKSLCCNNYVELCLVYRWQYYVNIPPDCLDIVVLISTNVI